MIKISNNPKAPTLQRKLTYDFYWLSSQKKIVIMCFISHYNDLDELVDGSGISSYQKPLTASDTLVKVPSGEFLSDMEVAQYDAYTNTMAVYTQALNSYNINKAAYDSQDPIIGVPPVPPVEPAPFPFIVMMEYDFYVNVLGVTQIVLPDLIENIIHARDLQKKLDT